MKPLIAQCSWDISNDILRYFQIISVSSRIFELNNKIKLFINFRLFLQLIGIL